MPYTCPAVQQVGVALSVGLAVISHPWLWTWFVPRYYMILVGIVVVIVLNKVRLTTWLLLSWDSTGALSRRGYAS